MHDQSRWVQYPSLKAMIQTAISVTTIISGIAQAQTPVFVGVDLPASVQTSLANGSVNEATIAQEHGLRFVPVGRLRALVPATCVVIPRPPQAPDFVSALGPSEALRLLMADLNAGNQRKLFGGEGLRAADLSGAYQQQLFGRVVNRGTFLTRPTAGVVPFTEVAVPVSQLAIRVTKSVRVYLPVAPNNPSLASPKIPGSLYASFPSRSEGRLFGGTPVATAPNQFKRSEWNLSPEQGSMKIRVPSGTRVGDLIGEVARRLRVELYADPRYQDRKVFVSGEAPVRITDLLLGVRLGLSATFRKVGPAYVLTDDLEGLGSRIERWRRFIGTSREDLRGRLEAATRTSRFEVAELSGSQDPCALNAEQQRQTSASPHGFAHVTTTYGELTPAQKEEVDRSVTLAGSASALGASSRVDLIVRPQLQILAPGIDEPVTVPGAADFLEAVARSKRTNPKPPISAPKGLSAALKVFERRSLVLAVDSQWRPEAKLLAQLRTIGIDELWLSVEGRVNPEVVTRSRQAGLKVRVLIQPFVAKMEDSSARPDLTILNETVTFNDLAGMIWTMPTSRNLDRVLLASGADGWVLDGLSVPGYAQLPDRFFDAGVPGLGYTESNRVQFLRKTSFDPIDLPAILPSELDAIPWPLSDRSSQVIRDRGYQQWVRARAEALVTVLQRVRAAKEPVLYQQLLAPLGGEWFGTLSRDLPGNPFAPFNPSQIEKPQEWSRTFSDIAYARCSVDPADPDAGSVLESAAREGFRRVALDLRPFAGDRTKMERVLRALVLGTSQ